MGCAVNMGRSEQFNLLLLFNFICFHFIYIKYIYIKCGQGKAKAEAYFG
jgi:hypothetical protein